VDKPQNSDSQPDWGQDLGSVRSAPYPMSDKKYYVNYMGWRQASPGFRL
jgi:hypothetical protein